MGCNRYLERGHPVESRIYKNCILWNHQALSNPGNHYGILQDSETKINEDIFKMLYLTLSWEHRNSLYNRILNSNLFSYRTVNKSTVNDFMFPLFTPYRVAFKMDIKILHASLSKIYHILCVRDDSTLYAVVPLLG